jgi:iron complex outermembrane recepter protein
MKPTRAFVALLIPMLVPTYGGAAAQEVEPVRTGTAVVHGVVVTEDTGTPLSATSVQLWSALDSAQVTATVTTETGRFRIDELVEGDYYLQVENLGYGTVTTEQFELADAEVRDLGTLRLPVQALALTPIEVSAERTAVTFEADRTSYNTGVMGVEGSSVTETLQLIPDLEVDIDGRVTVRGNAPAIYINGRAAPMSGEALTIFLEQFPAEYLQKIEVIDNPSARYDAEGSGGIVNLVMKEGVELGLSGSVFANAGTRGQYGLGARGTLQRGAWTFNGGGFLRLSDSERTGFDLRQNLLTDPAFVRQDSWSDRSGISGNVDLEVRFQPSERTRIYAEARLNPSGNDSEGLTTTTHLDDAEVPILAFERAASSVSRGFSGDVSAGLEYEWESGHELEVEVEAQSGRQRADGREEITGGHDLDDEALIPADLTLEDEDELEREVSFNIDYTRPLGEAVEMEMGFQAELEDSDNDRLIRLIEDPAALPDGQRTDRGFDQREVATAVYATLQREFGELGVQVGLRAEHVDAELVVPTGQTFGRDYVDLFPSLNLSYRVGESGRVRLSYSRRTGRPGPSVLNPIDRSTDPLNRRVGNPEIEANYRHSVSLHANWSGGIGSLRLSPYYEKTTNDWAEITTVDDHGVSTRTYQNLASEESYGASLTYSLPRRGTWGGRVSISGRRNVRDAGNLADRYSGSSFRWSSRANLEVALTDALSTQWNFSYSPPTDLPQGRTDARYASDLALRYRLLDDRASIRLSLRDPFGLREQSSRLEDLSYIQLGRSRESTRSAQISVSYSLGGGGRFRGGDGGGRRGR